MKCDSWSKTKEGYPLCTTFDPNLPSPRFSCEPQRATQPPDYTWSNTKHQRNHTQEQANADHTCIYINFF